MRQHSKKVFHIYNSVFPYLCRVSYLSCGDQGPALSKHAANPRPWIIENRVVRGGILTQ